MGDKSKTDPPLVGETGEASRLEVQGANELIQEALESMKARQDTVGNSDTNPEMVNPLQSSPVSSDTQENPPITRSEESSQENSNNQAAGDWETLLATEREKLQKRELEYKELYEKFLRLNADFDNFRKRNMREKAELRKYAHEGLAMDLLSVIDNFERALDTLGGASDSVREGIEMVYRQFLDMLGRHGVQRFEAKGEPFDYTKHEAISLFQTDECPPDQVYNVFQAGFTLHERLLRPAKVVVSKALEKSEPAKKVGDSGEDTLTDGQIPKVGAE